MLSLGISEIQSALDAQLCISKPDEIGIEPKQEAIQGVCTDSRHVAPGNLFFALRGPTFDGHQFIACAARAGARAAIVDHCTNTSIPQLKVRDTLAALGTLAGVWRSRHTPCAIAITGSNGKTTVKNIVSSILQERSETLATRGNLNNEIGVPLTLFELDKSHRFLVVELGASRMGDIAYLSKIAHPSIGVITQIAPAHLEGFGSVDNVARAKGELIDALPADGIAVLNVGDSFYAQLRARCGKRRCITFGTDVSADVTVGVDANPDGPTLRLQTTQGDIRARFGLLGRHNMLNAAAAAAAAIAAGASSNEIAIGLANVRPERGRLELFPLAAGQQLLNDTYNANPTSLRAALEVLAGFTGRKWLVLGDMGELGPESAEFHRAVAQLAHSSGVEKLFTLGEMAQLASDGFGINAWHSNDHDELIGELIAQLVENKARAAGSVTVLIKGSRSMQMEQVVNALMQEAPTCSLH